MLDLGGNRVGKRGLFDIEQYDFEVIYANLSRAKKPDVQSNASCLPFREAAFDAVICSELLEHVPYPPDVLREIFQSPPKKWNAANLCSVSGEDPRRPL